MSQTIFVNGRILSVRSNGQRRVAEQLIARLCDLQTICPPAQYSSGIAGHAWEQFVLPIRAAGKPLWSPATSGPIAHPNHIVTIHDLACLDTPEYFSKLVVSWYSIMSRAVATTARHIATVSRFSANRIMEHYRIRPEKITVIYSGVASAFHMRTAEEIAGVLEKYDLQNYAYVVAFSGSDPRKNTLGVVKAWEMSGAARNGHKLVLFGRHANAGFFADSPCIESVDGAVRVGAVDDDVLACLYSAAKGLVFPSYYEGFGLPVVEAARCGCRVVTSGITALPEVCPKDSLLIDPYNTGEIGEAISYILGVDDSVPSRKQRSEEMGIFDWDNAAREYSLMFRTFMK